MAVRELHWLSQPSTPQPGIGPVMNCAKEISQGVINPLPNVFPSFEV